MRNKLLVVDNYDRRCMEVDLARSAGEITETFCDLEVVSGVGVDCQSNGWKG